MIDELLAARKWKNFKSQAGTGNLSNEKFISKSNEMNAGKGQFATVMLLLHSSEIQMADTISTRYHFSVKF